MKRLLVVLFGVLVLQGSVWAKCGDPADKESAKFLSPGQDSVLIKGAPFVVQWQDDAKYLCKKVKIELIEVSGNRKTKVLSHSEDNVGYFTLDKLMASVKDKTSAEKPGHRTKFEYQFRISSIKKACKGAPCKILSKSFTLANAELAIYRKAHGKGSQRDVDLATNEVRDALVRLTALEERLEELLSQDGQVAEGAVINQNTGHDHDGRYARKHSDKKYSKLSHSHDNYAEVQSQIDTITTTITTVNSQVSALQAQLDALKVADNASILPEAQGVTDALDLGTYQWRSDGDCLIVNRHGLVSKDVYVEFRRNNDDNAAPVDFEVSDNSIVIILAARFFESNDHVNSLLEHWEAGMLRFDQKRFFELKRNGNCMEELEFNQMSGMHKLERQWLRLYRTNGLIVTNHSSQDYEREVDIKLTITVNNEEQRRLADFEVSDNSITLKLKNEVTNPMTIIKAWQNWRRENSARNFNLVLEDQNGVISQPLSNEGLLSVCGEQSKMYWRPCAQL